MKKYLLVVSLRFVVKCKLDLEMSESGILIFLVAREDYGVRKLGRVRL